MKERSIQIEDREEFGHWECDLVIGTRDNGAVLLTMTERKNRYPFILKLPDKKATTILKAFDKLFAIFGSDVGRVFKTLTIDNGSEFSSLSELKRISRSCT